MVCFLYPPRRPRSTQSTFSVGGCSIDPSSDSLERGQIGDPNPMPTKRAVLAELTSHELRDADRRLRVARSTTAVSGPSSSMP